MTVLPIYEYQCEECGLKFDRLRKMSESDAPQPCLECGMDARKLMSAVNHAFVHPTSQTRGMAPPNTGTSDDYNFDKAIGRDAAKRWEHIGDRIHRKKQVLKDNPGATGYDLSRNHDGSYRVMHPQERATSEAGRALGAEVQKAIQIEKQNGQL
jgi:putative FmdB family regulatory protein